MAKRQKLKEKLYPEENEVEKLKSVALMTSDDDDEANEDISLKIVEKHLLRRAAKFDQDGDGNISDVVFDDDSKNDSFVFTGSSETNDDVIIEDVRSDKKRVRVSKKKKDVEKMEICDQSVIVAKEEQKVETVDNGDEAVKAVETSDNIVLRKLLRGPRYFDPPDSGWQTCYNCGEEGHRAVNCASAVKRKKPCFVCGSLEHGVKQCSKAQDCFICKKGGHRAKDCPDKHSRNAQVCLKCGDSGHDMFSCRNNYSLEDLQEVQCYICKSFGHLCCISVTEASPKEVSCFRCGQFGHTGLACARSRGETAEASPSSCYKCGGEGHFARECVSSTKVHKRNVGETADAWSRGETTEAWPNSCYKCGGEGHFARECVSSASAKVRKRNIGETTEAWSHGETAEAWPNSCYKCGGEGHFARECLSSASGNVHKRNISKTATAEAWSRSETAEASSNSCYKCGGEGHFARECVSSAKVRKRNIGTTTPTLRPQRENKDYSRVKSAPHDLGKVRKKKKTQHEERGITTPRKSKPRGGWIADDPGDIAYGEPHRNHWWFHGTPSSKGHKISAITSSGHFSSPQSSKKLNSHHRYSASRFDNSCSDGIRRGYDWL